MSAADSTGFTLLPSDEGEDKKPRVPPEMHGSKRESEPTEASVPCGRRPCETRATLPTAHQHARELFRVFAGSLVGKTFEEAAAACDVSKLATIPEYPDGLTNDMIGEVLTTGESPSLSAYIKAQVDAKLAECRGQAPRNDSSTP